MLRYVVKWYMYHVLLQQRHMFSGFLIDLFVGVKKMSIFTIIVRKK